MGLFDDPLEFFQIAFDPIQRRAACVRHGGDDAVRAFRMAIALRHRDGDALADFKKGTGRDDSLSDQKVEGGSANADPPRNM